MIFKDKLAVVTGGGSGMGRELVLQLLELGCNVATCDLSDHALHELVERAESISSGAKAVTCVADVTDVKSIEAFRYVILDSFQTDHIHLLFNNAGVGGGGSFVTGSPELWERTFNICWGGVYNCSRMFMPLLVAAEQARIINTSSVCGFWAYMNPSTPNSAYSAAKFAIKGFTEALITELRLNAPHVECSVVMPGTIGTPLFANSSEILTGKVSERTAQVTNQFLDTASTTAAEAASIILDGVRAGNWRILVGSDAQELDKRVRALPEEAYETEFYDRLRKDGAWIM